MQWSFDRGFLSYVNSQELVKLAPPTDEPGNLYTKHGSWEFMMDSRRLRRDLHREYILNEDPSIKSKRDNRPPPPFGRPPRDKLPSKGRQILERILLLNNEQNKIVSRLA
ncbi:MAG: two-component system sensor histidine kinase BaeS [Pseudomonadales bacterium]|jgi:two-component system sensor histidine kinase BaeS